MPGTTTEIFDLSYYDIIDTGPCCCRAPLHETFSVDYCLVQQTPEHCHVGVALDLLIAVLVCNFVKALCLYWSLHKVCSNPLLTIGDAIASFLEAPDASTVGYGAISATDMSRIAKHAGTTPTGWEGKRRNGFYAASPIRWVLYNMG